MKFENPQEQMDEYYINNNVSDTRLEYERRESALLNVISSLQKELFHIKSLFSNWRDNHIIEDNQLRTVIIDPTVNLEIKELKQKIFEKDENLKKIRENVQALSFNPNKNSATGLINKCKKLINENRNLGHYVAEDKLQPLNILLTNNRKMIDALKSEIKQLRELNNEIDQDNHSLADQLDKMVKLYSSTKEENEKLNKENETLQTALNEAQTSDTQPAKPSSPEYSKDSRHSASPAHDTTSPARASRRAKSEKEIKTLSEKSRDKVSENKKIRGRSRDRTRDRSHKDTHRESDRFSKRKERPKSDKYRDRDRD